MGESARRVVRKLTAPRPVRYVLGTVLTVDEDGCEVDLGDLATVDAVVSSLVGSVSVNQDVRLSVQGNTYVVESVTSDEADDNVSYLAATGWSVSALAIRKSGRVAMFSAVFERTGAAITVSADGNVANQAVLTITDPSLRPVMPTAPTSYHTGPVAHYYMGTGGTLDLCAVSSGVTIPTGAELSAAATWITP